MPVFVDKSDCCSEYKAWEKSDGMYLLNDFPSRDKSMPFNEQFTL